MSKDIIFEVLKDAHTPCEHCRSVPSSDCVIPWVRAENGRERYLMRYLCETCWTYLQEQHRMPVLGDNEEDAWYALDLPDLGELF